MDRRVIDQALVDQVWRELNSYPPGRVQAEAEAFLDRQPHVAAFSQTLTKQLDGPVQHAAVGLCFLLFKILEAGRGELVPTVDETRILRAYEAATGARMVAGDAGAFLDDLEVGESSRLVAHIVSVFYGGNPASSEYDEEVKASLILLLRTLTGAVELGVAPP